MLKIDYKFKDVSLRQKAMTHSSYANEHHGTHLDCNERLEFLGDSVLGFVTADYLFTHYPELPEGELTKLPAAVVPLSFAFWPQPANSESAMTAAHKTGMIFFKMKCSFRTSIFVFGFLFPTLHRIRRGCKNEKSAYVKCV